MILCPKCANGDLWVDGECWRRRRDPNDEAAEWRWRVMVGVARTPRSQGGGTGSNPVGGTSTEALGRAPETVPGQGFRPFSAGRGCRRCHCPYWSVTARVAPFVPTLCHVRANRMIGGLASDVVRTVATEPLGTARSQRTPEALMAALPVARAPRHFGSSSGCGRGIDGRAPSRSEAGDLLAGVLLRIIEGVIRGPGSARSLGTRGV